MERSVSRVMITCSLTTIAMDTVILPQHKRLVVHYLDSLSFQFENGNYDSLGPRRCYLLVLTNLTRPVGSGGALGVYAPRKLVKRKMKNTDAVQCT